MTSEEEQKKVLEIKKYITDHFQLAQISNEELEEKVEQIVNEYMSDAYCSIQQKISIAGQVYGAIRGFGLLDSIINDDTITEVMINGPDRIFIEQNGRLYKLDKHFESEQNLEDIIQRIVGQAGREVNQASCHEGAIVDQDVIKKRFVGYLTGGDEAAADEFLKNVKVVDGLDGLDFSESYVADDTLYIVLNYELEYDMNVWSMDPVNVRQTTCSKYGRIWSDRNE